MIAIDKIQQSVAQARAHKRACEHILLYLDIHIQFIEYNIKKHSW